MHGRATRPVRPTCVGARFPATPGHYGRFSRGQGHEAAGRDPSADGPEPFPTPGAWPAPRVPGPTWLASGPRALAHARGCGAPHAARPALADITRLRWPNVRVAVRRRRLAGSVVRDASARGSRRRVALRGWVRSSLRLGGEERARALPQRRGDPRWPASCDAGRRGLVLDGRVSRPRPASKVWPSPCGSGRSEGAHAPPGGKP